MSSKTASSSGGGIGFLGLLTIAFIVLKLIGVIDWSWLWVLSPLWLPVAVVLGLALIALIVWAIYEGIKFLVLQIKNKKKVKGGKYAGK